jgi:hypothetical protein
MISRVRENSEVVIIYPDGFNNEMIYPFNIPMAIPMATPMENRTSACSGEPFAGRLKLFHNSSDAHMPGQRLKRSRMDPWTMKIFFGTPPERKLG